MAPVTFKITFGHIVRRFEAEGSIGWQEFVSKVRGLFSLPSDFAVRLTYVDEDRDLVTLDSDQEMQAILADAHRHGAQVVRFGLEDGSANRQETGHQTPDSSPWVFAEDSDENKEADSADAAEPSKESQQQAESGAASTPKPYSLAGDNEASTLNSSSTVHNSKPEDTHRGETLSVEIDYVTSDSDSDAEELEADPIPTHEKATKEKETPPKENATAEGEHTDSEEEDGEDDGIYLVIYLSQGLPNLFRRRRCWRQPAAPGFFSGYPATPHPFFQPLFYPYAAFPHHNAPFARPFAYSGAHCASTPSFYQDPIARMFAQTPCHRAANTTAEGPSSDPTTCQRGPCGGRAGCAKQPSQASPDQGPSCRARGRRGAACSPNADADAPKPTRCYRGRRRAGFCNRPGFSIDASCFAGPSNTSDEQAQSQDPTTTFQQGWRAFLTDQLAILKQMGFEDEALNQKLLERYNGSIVRVIDAQTRGKDAEEPLGEGNQASGDL